MKHLNREWLPAGLAVCLVVGTWGCESNQEANQSWSQFARCMVGDGVTEATALPRRIRSIELTERQPAASWDAKTQWPGRCEPYANALYGALGSATEKKIFKSMLARQMSCEDEKGCSFDAQGTILPDAPALWNAAKSAGLELDPNVEVPLPHHEVVVQDTKAWVPLVGKDYELADSYITRSGTLRLLFKSGSGPLTVCEAIADKGACQGISEEVPRLAPQSVRLVDDEEALVSGLTEEGRRAFDAKTGKEVTVRGAAGDAVRDGVVIEQAEGGKGFLAISMKQGKQRGEATFLPEPANQAQPVGVDAFATWSEGTGQAMKWRFAEVAGKKLKPTASFEGSFPGYLHPCSTPEAHAVGIWGRAQGEHDAQAVAGATPISASFLVDGKWSAPVSETMPFTRRVTTNRCAASQIEVYFAGSQAEQLEIGKIACTATGCSAASSQWPGFAAQRWLAAGPVGNDTFALWVTVLGETRLRVGDAKNFSSARETVLYETPEEGGPTFKNLQTYVTPHGTYLLVFDDAPTLLRVEAETLTPLAN